jgi:hypothetical protein
MGLVCPVMKNGYFYTTLKLNSKHKNEGFMKTCKRNTFLRLKN